MTHPHDLVEVIQGRLDRIHGYFRDYDWADAEDLKGLQDTLIDLGLEVAALRTTIERSGYLLGWYSDSLGDRVYGWHHNS